MLERECSEVHVVGALPHLSLPKMSQRGAQTVPSVKAYKTGGTGNSLPAVNVR